MRQLQIFYIIIFIFQCQSKHIKPLRSEEVNVTIIIESQQSEPIIYQESIVITSDAENTNLGERNDQYNENRDSQILRTPQNDEIRFPDDTRDSSIILQNNQPVIERFPISSVDNVELMNINNKRKLNSLDKSNQDPRPFNQVNRNNNKHYQESVDNHDSSNYEEETIDRTNKNKNKIIDNYIFKTTTRRICEKKYDEYIRQIYRQENPQHDLNETDFDGRLLAEPGEYPHMAALGFQTEGGQYDYKCGGSLISDYFVLTAAHCANFSGQAPSKVRIGDLNLMIEERELRPQTIDIERIYLHPDYNDSLYYNDLALLQLSTPVIFSETARPIRLWTRADTSFPNVYAMGYGSTGFAKPMTRQLTYFNLTLVPNVECNRTLPFQPETPEGIISSQICAFDSEMKRDTCQGDSGGPLQYTLEEKRNKKRKHYLLLGIISYGLYCRSNYPSVYTRIFSYLDWIEEIVWDDN